MDSKHTILMVLSFSLSAVCFAFRYRTNNAKWIIPQLFLSILMVGIAGHAYKHNNAKKVLINSPKVIQH